ncbi:MAG: tRNA (adenosine(37)-N6)-threonylcarbamoyltransferase complex dimerization subunit type 1 TsaB [Pseudomonadota bacterium]
MANLLAIDTATDTLSLALEVDRGIRGIHRALARQHQQQLFQLLDEVLAGADIRELGLDVIAYGSGPGSFTGLRIAVSFAQGLGYSLGVPVIKVSSLEVQAQTALRHLQVFADREATDPDLDGVVNANSVLLSTIDARMGQVYAQWFKVAPSDHSGFSLQPVADESAFVVASDQLAPPAWLTADDRIIVLGSGATSVVEHAQVDQTSAEHLRRDQIVSGELLESITPDALDLLSLARSRLDKEDTLTPQDARPDYVQPKLPWKKLADQGKPA